MSQWPQRAILTVEYLVLTVRKLQLEIIMIYLFKYNFETYLIAIKKSRSDIPIQF